MDASQQPLFGAAESDEARSEMPLAARVRPRDLDEFVGQERVLG